MDLLSHFQQDKIRKQTNVQVNIYKFLAQTPPPPSNNRRVVPTSGVIVIVMVVVVVVVS